MHLQHKTEYMPASFWGSSTPSAQLQCLCSRAGEAWNKARYMHHSDNLSSSKTEPKFGNFFGLCLLWHAQMLKLQRASDKATTRKAQQLVGSYSTTLICTCSTCAFVCAPNFVFPPFNYSVAQCQAANLQHAVKRSQVWYIGLAFPTSLITLHFLLLWLHCGLLPLSCMWLPCVFIHHHSNKMDLL